MKKETLLIETIIQTLQQNHQTISFAESCTGGRIASAFTAISGVSSVFNGSCVTYSNDIKEQWLGVKKETLETEGAVSHSCVEQMLQGIQKMTQSDYAIAISGIAGPSGGTPTKPVGSVYIGILSPSYGIEVNFYLFKGSREEIQTEATKSAIDALSKRVK